MNQIWLDVQLTLLKWQPSVKTSCPHIPKPNQTRQACLWTMLIGHFECRMRRYSVSDPIVETEAKIKWRAAPRGTPRLGFTHTCLSLILTSTAREELQLPINTSSISRVCRNTASVLEPTTDVLKVSHIKVSLVRLGGGLAAGWVGGLDNEEKVIPVHPVSSLWCCWMI